MCASWVSVSLWSCTMSNDCAIPLWIFSPVHWVNLPRYNYSPLFRLSISNLWPPLRWHWTIRIHSTVTVDVHPSQHQCTVLSVSKSLPIWHTKRVKLYAVPVSPIRWCMWTVSIESRIQRFSERLLLAWEDRLSDLDSLLKWTKKWKTEIDLLAFVIQRTFTRIEITGRSECTSKDIEDASVLPFSFTFHCETISDDHSNHFTDS